MGNVPERRMFVAYETDRPAMEVLRRLKSSGEATAKIVDIGDVPKTTKTEIFAIVTNTSLKEPVKPKRGGFVMIAGNDVTANQVLSALEAQYATM